MSNIRLFFKESLSLNLTAKLNKSQSHYINKVMRVKLSEIFSLFNSSGEWEAKILSISKGIVEFNIIKKINVDILTEHTTAHRPWGKFDLILNERNSKIKKITVKPKSELSYQSHKYRNEHWIVLKGVATIKKNGKTFKIKKDESTYIAKGDKHRLINNENIDLEIIEVQTGVKVSEKDIIRYDDIYGRN